LFEEHEWCSRLVRVALELSNKYLPRYGRTRERCEVTSNMGNAFAWLGDNHMRVSFAFFEECLQSAYTIGDVWFITLSYSYLWQCHFFVENSLDEVYQKLEECKSAVYPLAQANQWTVMAEITVIGTVSALPELRAHL